MNMTFTAAKLAECFKLIAKHTESTDTVAKVYLDRGVIIMASRKYFSFSDTRNYMKTSWSSSKTTDI
jgi:hypothetical protein